MAEMAGERSWICSRRLAERRTQLGLTQSQLAQRLVRQGLHCSNRTVSRLENGQGVDADRLPALAAALECTVTYLVGLTDLPDQWEPRRPLGIPVPTTEAAPDEGQVDSHHVWILGPATAATAATKAGRAASQ
jgi:transcriptional regulator with XRE-family HTH domain